VRLRGAAVRAAAAGVARLARIATPAPEAVVVRAAGIVQLRLGSRRPPDQPEAEEDRDLQDHGQENDRQHPIHLGESTPDQSTDIGDVYLRTGRSTRRATERAE
jgi:hypothetical protein